MTCWWAGDPALVEPTYQPELGHAADWLWLNFLFAEALLLPLELDGLKREYRERYDRDGRHDANEWLRIQVRGE